MKIGNRDFDLKNKTYIMGILNVTPDSFSDGGKWNHMDQALFHVEEMIEDGVDIVDIGGESTRPGYTFLSDEEEISRVIPIIEKLKSEFDIPLSIDTYKSKVAKASIHAGVDLINDIWGLKFDEKMAKTIGDSNLPCCLMHNRLNSIYTDYLNDVSRDLKETLDLAKEAGIKESNIILDPGIGFAKSHEENLILMNHLEKLHAFKLPILLGTSRKSMIGLALNLPVNERLEGTIATTVIGVMKGCSIIRVHDVKENKRAVLMTEAILKSYDI